MVILKFDFKSLNDKIVNSASSSSKVKSKNMGTIFGCSSFGFESFLERENASL